MTNISVANSVANTTGDGAAGLLPDCLGACGNRASVLLRKRCDTCEERTNCPCEPSWCHECLLRWWLTKNRTRVEIAAGGGPGK